MGRLSIALVIATLSVACNSKSLKPNYCHVQADCTTGTCDNHDGGTFMCIRTDGPVDIDGGDADTGPPKCTSDDYCLGLSVDGGPNKSAILNNTGAAAVRPVMPGSGVPSGRPAHTAMVTSAS